MADIKPILDDVDVRTYQGKYKVQLEIPQDSSLTPCEIDQIGNLASWNVDPNGTVDGYEGGRAVLIARECPIQKQGIPLTALQISGIGYTNIDFIGEIGTTPDSTFHKPCSDNFISRMPGTKMSTSYGRGTNFVTTRPAYRALGVYTAEELETTVRKTLEASRFQLESVVTPNLEAYGRYLDETLGDANGQFGFVVFPVPGVHKPRAGQEVVDKLSEIMSRERLSTSDFLLALWSISGAYNAQLTAGLRELHDRARVAHLQAHLSNFYLVNGKPYLMDWATMARLEEDRETNISNRTLDLFQPVDTFNLLLKAFLPNLTQPQIEQMDRKCQELAMEVYSEHPETEIDILVPELRYYFLTGKTQATGFEVARQWVKDLGVEGFPKYDYRKEREFISSRFKNNQTPDLPVRKQHNIGRNDPCSCGSGKKFKNCCMH